MKLNNIALQNAISYVGFDFNRSSMTVYVPADDYDDNDELSYESVIKIVVQPMESFGKVGKVGRHLMPESLSDISRALVDCSHDGFETLYLYTSV